LPSHEGLVQGGAHATQSKDHAMTERTPAVVLYARRVPGTRAAMVETLGSLLGAVPSHGQYAPRGLGRCFGMLDRNAYTSLSYVIDWLDAFRRAPTLDAHCFNIVNLLEWPRARAMIRSAPLVVVLHSAAGDDLSLISRLASALSERRGRLLLFFGNEYTLMPAKIRLAQQTQADMVASQLPDAAAAWLYAECPASRILHAPAALNPARYHPLAVQREVDLGFRGDLYPFFIGDDERTRILEFFRLHAADYDLSADISYSRISGPRWHRFLAACRGIVGAEAGTYYLERDDHTAAAVAAHLERVPRASFDEIRSRFFDHYAGAVSGKAISSRHFEAVGTKTCQLLLEGQYNGVLEPDAHYLSIKHDYSNMAEVVARFKDPAERARVTEAAYEHVMARHTYDRRVSDLLAQALA
jgi:hypothetical protein